MSQIKSVPIIAIDLFCGAGGLTKGLEDVGIQVACGIDIDPACEYPYQKNNKAKFLKKSVSDLKKEDLFPFFKNTEFTLLAGCAPCQPFSKYRLGKSDETDNRWNLLGEFQRLALQLKPTIITMENVPRIAEQKVFTEFVAALEGAEYKVNFSVVKCADYGVPQQRERLVLLASKLGPIKLIAPTCKKYRTVRQAIGKMPSLRAGSSDIDDALHKAASLSPLNMQRIKASKPGETWRDWERNLVAECHKKKSGKTYPSVYGRMEWDEPAPTMTTQFFGFGNGRFGHPKQNRAISLREGAILQGFPKNYVFTEPGKPIYQKTVGRLIGNAVPVKLAAAVGKSIVKHIETHIKGITSKQVSIRD